MASEKSVTQQVAEWIVSVTYDDAPARGTEAVRNLVLDSIGNQFAGMSGSTGRLLTEWVREQGGNPVSTVTAGGFKTKDLFELEDASQREPVKVQF